MFSLNNDYNDYSGFRLFADEVVEPSLHRSEVVDSSLHPSELVDSSLHSAFHQSFPKSPVKRKFEDGDGEPPRKRCRKEVDQLVLVEAQKRLHNFVNLKAKQYLQEIRNEIDAEVKCLVNGGSSEAANRLFQEMYSSNDPILGPVTPDKYSYSHLLNSFYKNKCYSKVLVLHKQMCENGTQLNNKSIEPVINSFIFENEDDSESIIKFYEKHFSSRQSELSLKLFAKIMKTYLAAGKYNQVTHMYNSALQNRRKMDCMTLSTVLSAFTKLNNFQEALDIIMNREKLGFGNYINKFILSKLMTIHSHMGHPEKAIEAFQEFQQSDNTKTELDDFTLLSLMHAYLELKDATQALFYYNQTSSKSTKVHDLLVEAYLELNEVNQAKRVFIDWNIGTPVNIERNLPKIDSHNKSHGSAVTEILCFLDTLSPESNTKFQVVTGKGLHRKGSDEMFKMKNYIIDYFSRHKNDFKGDIAVRTDENNSGVLWFTYGVKKFRELTEKLKVSDYRLLPLWNGYSNEERSIIASYLCDKKNASTAIKYLAQHFYWVSEKNQDKLESLRFCEENPSSRLFQIIIQSEWENKFHPPQVYDYDRGNKTFVRQNPQDEVNSTSEGKIYHRNLDGNSMKYDLLLPNSLIEQGCEHFKKYKKTKRV
ncbi:MAG: tetratricopeptide repeat protein [Chlamydiota bacterium]|nr:tetratricopeptide repeat protein [Chlamydiota bacterium]